MSKTRLTKADRETIRDAILDHKFKPIQAALKAQEGGLAEEVRANVYGAYLATIEAAPPGAFCEDDDITVNVGGKRIRLLFGGEYPNAVRHRVFDEHRTGYILSVPEDNRLGAKVLAWATASEKARTDRDDLRRSVLGTLSAFTTFDDLLKGWPEAERFITAAWRERPEYVANVPAIVIADLSAKLDLPPDLAEAA